MSDDNPYRSPDSAPEAPRGPVKIKAYGLTMTKNGYLLLQAVVVVGVVALLLGLRPVFAAPDSPFSFVDAHFWTIIAVLLALEGLETVAMLWRFSKAEKERAL